MPARFYEQDIKSGLKNKRLLSAFIDKVVFTHLKKVKKNALNYIFCNDTYLLHMNKEYLNHDTLTDIITFDLSDNKNELQGEIYISVERVKENAEKFGVSYNDELHRVIFHGALHLCGFKDKKKEDIAEMRVQENKCLTDYKKTA